MDSFNGKGKTEKGLLEETKQVFEDLDEVSFQNLAAEMRFKVELEREDLKCSYLKFEVENVQGACTQAADCADYLRKSLAETQTEMDQINDEIVKQKEAIENVCSGDRVKNFSNVVEAVSHAVEEYKELKLILETEVKNRSYYSSRIDDTMQEIRNVSNLVNTTKKEQENIVNQVECKTQRLRRRMEDLSDEKIEQLRQEFANCMTLKDELLSLEVRKRELNDKYEESMKNRQEIQDDICNLSDRYNDLKTLHVEELKDLRMENEAWKNDLESIKNSYRTDTNAQIRLLLNNLKSELNSLKKLSETLRSQKNELRNDDVLIQCQQIEIKEQIIKTEEDKTTVWEIEKKTDEKTMHVLQNQMKILEGNLLDALNQLETLKDEVSHLEVEYESFRYITEEELIDEFGTKWDILEEDLKNSNRALNSLKNEENRVRGVVEKLEPVEKQHLSQIEAKMILIEKLESVNQEDEENLTQLIAKENQQINCHFKDIIASAIDKYEKDLLLDILREDSLSYKKAYTKKQYEMWTSNQENEKKITEHEMWTKKLAQEQSNFDSLRNLVQDLEKNTIPNEEIPDTWFQSFEQEKKKFKILRKERLALEKEKASICEKLEKYEYAEYKVRRVSQSLSNLNLNETNTKKKSKNDRIKKKN